MAIPATVIMRGISRCADPPGRGGQHRRLHRRKASLGIATVIAAERLWKTNKVAAIAVMVASNGVSAIVAARNAQTLRQLR